MCIEELKSTCIRATARSRWKIVDLDWELFQLRDAPVELGYKCIERRWIQRGASTVTENEMKV